MITIDFFAVVDYQSYTDHLGNKTQIEIQIESVISTSNAILLANGIPVIIDLVNVTYFTDFIFDQTVLGAPSTIAADILTNFKSYRSTRFDVVPTNIFWLFTSRTNLGLAELSSISGSSTPNFTSLIVFNLFNTRLMTHGLGHNFSEGHDGVSNTCNLDNYIMAQFNSTATEYSLCSMIKFNTFLAKIFGFEEFNQPYILRWSSGKTIELGSTKSELLWNATDAFPETYTTYLNNIPLVVNQTWSNHTRETIDLTGLDLGDYNYSITYTDLFGNQNSAYTVVSVVDTTSPTIEFIGQTVFNKDITGNLGKWQIIDLKPNFVEIHLDGEYFNKSKWVTDELFTLNLDTLSVGEHKLTIVAYDSSMNQITLDTIIYIYLDATDQHDTSTFTTTETVVVTSEIVTTREVVQTLQKSEAGLSYPFLVMFSSLLLINIIIRRRK